MSSPSKYLPVETTTGNTRTRSLSVVSATSTKSQSKLSAPDRKSSSDLNDDDSALNKSANRRSAELPGFKKVVKDKPQIFKTTEAMLAGMQPARAARVRAAQARWRKLTFAFSITRVMKLYLKDRRLFGSKSVTSGVSEKVGRFFFDPTNRWLHFWDAILFVSIMFNIIAAPINACFQSGENLSYAVIALGVVTDVMFFGDMWLSAHMGFHLDGVLIKDEMLIKRRYFKRAFWSDLVSQIPMDYIALMVRRDAPLVGGLRLTRVLYMRKLPRFFNDWEEAIDFNPIFLRFLKLGLWIAILAHFVGCLWYRIGFYGATQFPPEGWLAVDKLSINDPLLYRYVRSMYFAIQTLATVGYGDILPITDLEMIFAVLVMIVGQGIYAVIIGNMSSLIADADSLAATFSAKMDTISAYLRYRKIPGPLRSKIHSYYDYIYSEHKGVDENDALKELPQALRNEVMGFQCENALYNTLLFKNSEKTFLNHLISTMVSVVFSPGDIIVKENDFGEGMFVVLRGTLHVIANIDSPEEVLLGSLGPGAVFGEVSLLERTRRKFTIKAHSFCDAFFLDTDSFTEACEAFPTAKLGILETLLDDESDIESDGDGDGQDQGRDQDNNNNSNSNRNGDADEIKEEGGK